MTTKSKKISSVFWDYDFSEEELIDLLYGKITRLGFLDREKLIIRMITYLNWYDFIKLVPVNLLTQILNEKLLENISDEKIVKGLKVVKRLLQQESVSTAR
ncbi:MAG: hypothetical protein KJ963_06585 [Bacteroidetes bacterium]|nr:hypothetical protein [Bacteroidota bacterium]MBU1422957.1 hypothetical protein [Bacteroidota bacterium]MBU2636734.1 hypothetical protein [Bacteroidota bacterium]